MKKVAILIFVISIPLHSLIRPVFSGDANDKTDEQSAELSKLENEIIVETKELEDLLYKRGNFYEDEEALAYVNMIAHKMVPAELSWDGRIRINVKIIRDATVNAFAFANGSIYITTGALARFENEAQLAFVLGHEISHVVNKDIVHYTHDRQGKTVAYKLVDIFLAPTSVFFGIFGDLTQFGFGLLYVSSVTGYGRTIEARADVDSVPMVTEQGYEPEEAIGAIEVLLKEKEKYQKGTEVFFLMDHPSNEWRLKKLQTLVAERYSEQKGERVGSEEFRMNMAKMKLYNASLNIKMDRLEHARDNIQWMLEQFPRDPEARYLSGEIYRLGAEDKDKLKDELTNEKWAELNKGYKKGELEEKWLKKAQDEYNVAIESDPNYANSYKGLALLYNYKKEKESALKNLQKYLELAPNADDARYVKNLMERLKRPEEGK